MRTFVLVVAALVAAVGLVAQEASACKRMTAAIRWRGRAFLFFANDYVSLDAHYVQNGTGDVFTDWGVPWPDAAVVNSDDHADYYFSDSYFFGPYNNYSPVDADHIDKFFQHGLDAAGNIDGVTCFFKGCQYVKNKMGVVSAPMDLPEGVPCNMDAALTEGKNLLVFKDDMMWVVEPSGLQSNMPIPTDLMITLDEITLCQEGEKEE